MRALNTAKKLILASSVVATLAPRCGSAQDASQNTSQDAGQTQLQTVVVTANRRQQSILNVPVSVSAQTQESLDRQGVRSLSDLANLTPGLQFAPNGYTGGSQISIRGISSVIGAATTAVYINDTPFQVRQLGAADASSNTYPPIFDLQRVEVLRGPQGTLFGASAEGGAVRFITPEPGLTSYSAYSREELGFTDGGDPSTEVGVAGGGPIVSDVLGFRLSAYDQRDGGWIDRVNPFTQSVVAKDTNSDETQALSGSLKLLATQNFSLTGMIYHARLAGHDLNADWRSLSDPSVGRFYLGDSLRQPWDDRYTVYSVSADYQLESAEVISETSYFTRNDHFTPDYTAVIPELLSLPAILGAQVGTFTQADFLQHQQTFTEDTRLQSKGQGRLSWVTGIFYESAHQQISEWLPTVNPNGLTLAGYGETVANLFGVPPLEPGNGLYLGLDGSRDTEYALYGQVDYRPIDRLTLTAGVRVAKDQFYATNAQSGPFGSGDVPIVMGESDKPVTPKTSVSYKTSESTMVYASVAKGFRPGGGNTPVPESVCAAQLAAVGLKGPPASYSPDYVWSYEVGAKGAVADHRVTFESSAFYINWKDIQSIIPLSCGFTITENAAQAVSKGADLQISVLPITGLSFTAAAGYTDARYSKPLLGGYLASGQRAVVIGEGDRLSGHPVTVSLHGEYNAPLSSQAELMGYLHADYDYASGYKVYSAGTTTIDPLNNYVFATHLTNLRAGIRTESVDASLYMNNVFNSHDITSTGHAYNSELYEDGFFRPRTIGVTVTYRYQ
jgi:outer membrane receptor protein involved in Fe transport